MLIENLPLNKYISTNFSFKQTSSMFKTQTQREFVLRYSILERVARRLSLWFYSQNAIGSNTLPYESSRQLVRSCHWVRERSPWRKVLKSYVDTSLVIGDDNQALPRTFWWKQASHKYKYIIVIDIVEGNHSLTRSFLFYIGLNDYIFVYCTI